MRSAAASSKAREGTLGTSLRALLLLAIGASFVVAAAPARAGCPLTDPACVTETVDGGVAPVTEVTDPVVDQVVDPVTQVTDPVIGTIGGGVDKVKDTVGPTVDVTEPLAPGDSGVAPDPPTGPGAPPGDSGNVRSDLGSGSFVERPVPVPALVGGAFIPSLESVPPSPDVRIGASPPAERSGVSFENVVQGLAFPLALALIVGAFLLAQNRLDRRDPRLALAPVGPDVLDFT
jgi:hypothetical protein